MPHAPHPTSIRLSAELKQKLRHQAEQESRTLAQHIVHILKTATAFVRVPRKRRATEKPETEIPAAPQDSE